MVQPTSRLSVDSDICLHLRNQTDKMAIQQHEYFTHDIYRSPTEPPAWV